jgi:hypothetical protein
LLQQSSFLEECFKVMAVYTICATSVRKLMPLGGARDAGLQSILDGKPAQVISAVE